MAGVIIGLISCDDPKAQPVYCPDTDNNGNGHLGIGEDCIKDTGDCTGLQNYNTSTGVNAFPKPIYRVGKAGDFNANLLAKTVNDVMSTYTDPSILGLTEAGKDRLSQRLDFVQIYKTGGNYTWKDKVLGLRVGVEKGVVWYCIAQISVSSGLTPTAQLQPVGNIRMAKGKKSTEQFPVIAGGADKDPKVNTVAQNFNSNRQVIARNNRNVKTLLRHV